MIATVEEIEHRPRSLVEPLNFVETFGRNAPVEIDLGCGDGTFLVQMATENPEHDFLGIDRLALRVRSACRKAKMSQLSNVRVLRIEAGYAMTYLVPAESVSVIHMLFPDPWPKRRHHRRRTFTVQFLLATHRALVFDGLLHVATDDADYFHEMERILSAQPLFKLSSEQPDFSGDEV